jgi:hypothetical protein
LKFLAKDGDELQQTSSKHAKMSGLYVNNRGFPSVNLDRERKIIVMAFVMFQEYKLINGCPTTLVIENGSLVVNGHSNQYYNLLVRPKGQTIIYMFQTYGLAGVSPNPGLTEIKAVRESIRVFTMR